MKSYVLDGLENEDAAERELSALLPGQTAPWLILAKPDDPIAYLHVGTPCEDWEIGPFLVQADMSGRHHNEDDAVVRVLRAIQAKLGGQLTDDDDTVL